MTDLGARTCARVRTDPALRLVVTLHVSRKG